MTASGPKDERSKLMAEARQLDQQLHQKLNNIHVLLTEKVSNEKQRNAVRAIADKQLKSIYETLDTFYKSPQTESFEKLSTAFEAIKEKVRIASKEIFTQTNFSYPYIAAQIRPELDSISNSILPPRRGTVVTPRPIGIEDKAKTKAEVDKLLRAFTETPEERVKRQQAMKDKATSATVGSRPATPTAELKSPEIQKTKEQLSVELDQLHNRVQHLLKGITSLDVPDKKVKEFTAHAIAISPELSALRTAVKDSKTDDIKPYLDQLAKLTQKFNTPIEKELQTLGNKTLKIKEANVRGILQENQTLSIPQRSRTLTGVGAGAKVNQTHAELDREPSRTPSPERKVSPPATPTASRSSVTSSPLTPIKQKYDGVGEINLQGYMKDELIILKARLEAFSSLERLSTKDTKVIDSILAYIKPRIEEFNRLIEAQKVSRKDPEYKSKIQQLFTDVDKLSTELDKKAHEIMHEKVGITRRHVDDGILRKMSDATPNQATKDAILEAYSNHPLLKIDKEKTDVKVKTLPPPGGKGG